MSSGKIEKSYRNIFKIAPVGMALVAPDGKPSIVNHFMQEMLGYSEEELRQMSFVDFTHPEDVDKDWALFDKLKAGEIDNYEIEKRYVTKGKGILWVELRVSLADDGFALAVIKDISERLDLRTNLINKSAELQRSVEELTTKNIDLQLTQKMARIGSWEMNLEADSVYLSDLICDVYGLPHGTTLSLEDGIRYYHRDSVPVIEEAFDNLIKQRQPYDCDLLLVSSEGIETWVRTIGAPIVKKGKVVGAKGLFQDIDRQKRVERDISVKRERLEKQKTKLTRLNKRLKISNELLAQKAHILDSIQDAVISITRSGNVTYWNKAAETLFGYDQSMIADKTLKELNICTEKDGLIKRDIRRLIREGTLTREYELKDRQGRIIFARVNASVLVNSMSQIEGVLGICSDITEEKRLNERIEQTSLQYENLIANVPGMVFRCGFSPKFPLQFISRGCKKLTGYRPKELLDSDCLMEEIVHDDNREERWQSIRAAAERGDSYSLVYRIRTKNGELKWVMENGTVIGGKKVGQGAIEGVVYDHTGRVELRVELMNAIMHTETSERSRISKEIHDGLQQTLTSSFLHFEKIKGYLAESEEEVFKKYQTGYELLQNAIQEARGIAHRLLPKVIEDHSLIQALESLLKEYEGAMFNIEFGHNLTINTELDKNIELVIYRIIQEALTNVMKYAYARKVDLQIFKYSDQVILTLEDDGVGFDMLKTTDSNFGLISMKSRAAAVGGFIQIDSRTGVGTNILLAVPLYEEN